MKPITVFLIVLVVGGGAFYGGMQYQKSQVSGGRNFVSGQGGVGRGGQLGSRRMGNGQPVAGEIINMDDSTITVKLMDGSSRIVLLTEKTIFNKTASVSKSELKIGERIGVFGTSNTDGSVTAQNVQLNPQFRMGAPSASGSAR